jgi:hypothetical protein
MTMRVTLKFNGKTYRPVSPIETHHTHVVFDVACPGCKASPTKVAGVKGTMTHNHDTYRADAGCLECQAPMGHLETKVDTIFGIEEDRAVLNGRCRVY